MLSYQIESYDDCREEIDRLLEMHWHEVARDHADVPLAKDEARYQKLADDGCLHIVTVRVDGELVGYHASIVSTHLHYKTTLHALVDVYFIKPEFRKGMTGINLFRFAEKSLAARGVVKVITGTKLHLDMSKIFERLGWRHTEAVYTKLLRPSP